MSYAIGGLVVLLAIFLVATAFIRANPVKLARTLRTAGPLVLGLSGLLLLLAGRAGVGGLLFSLALAWYGASRLGTPARPRTAGKRSSVRTAALEMELDHDTGKLEGMVLAGRHEQRMLGTMSLRELRELYEDLKGDPESRQLLETYLDGRFPAWREHAKAQAGDGQRVAPGAGAMTKQEAYEILGLEAGASPADIRKAHRRLMQRLHPDLGGTSFLAARINEAKDVLLANHH
ncbi:DnaJ domain-containing protein [Mesorhizobium sp. LHD-90]|uniref:DnaJ domain-containing protein n=1 Tax=Mesorhizobium sp. LHD-90 TaxID=3071414 RepID=UPI0027DF2A4B|nr:DnaJ domain-containing protein [Mesorhizobium sp. LHD-90]MDQ6437752.1 DnaJ domain-containing protein [Mesorhizobium sp. LHD-90]